MSIIDSSTSPQSVAATTKTTTPDVPAGWAPLMSNKVVAVAAEVETAGAAAEELADMADYGALFARKAPSQEALVAGLLAAQDAHEERGRAEAWLAYCRDQEARAFTEILPLVFGLRDHWALAIKGEPELANRYPRVAQLMAARHEIGVRAARTRVRNQKSKAKRREESTPVGPGSTNQRP